MHLEKQIEPFMTEKWEVLENFWEQEVLLKKPLRTKFRDHPPRFQWASKTAKRKNRQTFRSDHSLSGLN